MEFHFNPGDPSPTSEGPYNELMQSRAKSNSKVYLADRCEMHQSMKSHAVQSDPPLSEIQ